MVRTVEDSFVALKTYCENEEFKGWDPYDGLNSRVFQATPFKYWHISRLAWIQLFKRSPVNFREVLFVPKEYNAKGISLLLNGYCNLYALMQKGGNCFCSQEELLSKINRLVTILLKLKNKEYSGACWGYNFDWQSKAFFLPRDTPTVVATAFVVDALLGAYEVTRDEECLNTALSSASFVVNDLNRIKKNDGLFMFSYSPLDEQAVYNATLLGTKILSQLYSYTGDRDMKELAYISALAVCNCQNKDGSFPHSDQVGQAWRDNFHTGFNLECLISYQNICGDNRFKAHIEKGFLYWVSNYFDHETGYSYYYDRGMAEGLIDLHCAAQAFATFYKLGKAIEYWQLVDKIAQWPVANMFSDKGFFYFQKIGRKINKIEYMRWPNAWMFYGLSYYLLIKDNYDKA